MVKELQRKFTFAAMAAVTILLLTLVGAINVLHLVLVTGQQDRMLHILCELDGNPEERFAPGAFFREAEEGEADGEDALQKIKEQNEREYRQQGGAVQGMPGRGLPPDREGWPGPARNVFADRRISVDDAMSRRFFSAWFDGDGELVRTDASRIYAVTEEGAGEMAREILSRGKESGRLRGFRFLLADKGAQASAAGSAKASTAKPSSAAESAKTSAAGLPFAAESAKASTTKPSSAAESAQMGTADAPSGAGLLLVAMDVSGDDENLLLVLGISAVIAGLCWAAMLLPVHILARRAIAPTAESIVRQKQFVTNAGHELKTPLAIIQANTEALELFNGESKWTRNIRAQTVRLSGLMQNLLTLSRMDEKALNLERKPFDLSGLAGEVWESFSQSAAGRELTAELSLDGPVQALGDRESVSQLLSILFDNAVKYTPRGGNIRIKTMAEGKEAVLVQSNSLAQKDGKEADGGGIPEDPERLFERFYRADEGRSRKKGGYGIGLSAARAIAAANRGTIRAEAADGRIRFTVRLPKADSDERYTRVLREKAARNTSNSVAV